MKRNEGFEVKLASFLTSTKGGGEWLSLHLLGRFTPGKRIHFTIRIGDDVRDQSKSGLSKGEGNISLCLEMNPDSTFVQPALQ
jgi:hypothetical protein